MGFKLFKPSLTKEQPMKIFKYPLLFASLILFGCSMNINSPVTYKREQSKRQEMPYYVERFTRGQRVKQWGMQTYDSDEDTDPDFRHIYLKFETGEIRTLGFAYRGKKINPNPIVRKDYGPLVRNRDGEKFRTYNIFIDNEPDGKPDIVRSGVRRISRSDEYEKPKSVESLYQSF